MYDLDGEKRCRIENAMNINGGSRIGMGPVTMPSMDGDEEKFSDEWGEGVVYIS